MSTAIVTLLGNDCLRFKREVVLTRHKAIVIHEDFTSDFISFDEQWGVSAIPCGVSIGWARSRRGAELLAAIYAALPVEWEKLGVNNHAQAKTRANEILAKLPAELGKWLGTIRRNGAL